MWIFIELLQRKIQQMVHILGRLLKVLNWMLSPIQGSQAEIKGRKMQIQEMVKNFVIVFSPHQILISFSRPQMKFGH